MRRSLFLIVLLASTAWLSYAAGEPGRPYNLKCEYLSNPLGVDVRQPRFFWVLDHPERSQRQTAYQLLVGTRPDLLAQDTGDQWDSGKVSSEQSTQVVYGGKPLEGGRTYCWKVRYWDKQGNAGPYSAPAQFDMGLLAAAEWKGQWIGGANQLRTEFQLPEAVVRARAYISGLGYYELRVNGAKAGRSVLDPGWTTYARRVLYSTYDVTPMLRRGPNAVGVLLGKGWYGSTTLLLQLNIEWPAASASASPAAPPHGKLTTGRSFETAFTTARFTTRGWRPAAGTSPASAIPAGTPRRRWRPPRAFSPPR